MRCEVDESPNQAVVRHREATGEKGRQAACPHHPVSEGAPPLGTRDAEAQREMLRVEDV